MHILEQCATCPTCTPPPLAGSPSLYDMDMDALLSRLSIEELCPACRLDTLTLERLPDRPSAPDIFYDLGLW